MTEIFSDLYVYFSLQYRQEIDRWREQVRQEPRNARARLELGRTLLKCGLYREAVNELAQVDPDSGSRRRALYNSLVAGCRGGLYAGAIENGVACLEIEPNDERARYWLWLVVAVARRCVSSRASPAGSRSTPNRRAAAPAGGAPHAALGNPSLSRISRICP